MTGRCDMPQAHHPIVQEVLMGPKWVGQEDWLLVIPPRALLCPSSFFPHFLKSSESHLEFAAR